MKKNNKTILSLIVLMIVAQLAGAFPSIDKLKAKNVLMKTNRAIGVAHIVVKKTRAFSGALGKAVKHERYAKKLYTEGKYDRAVFHSLKARQYANEVMKASNAKPTTDFLVSAEETKLAGTLPSDQTLEDDVNADNPAVIKDEDLMNGGLDLEVQ